MIKANLTIKAWCPLDTFLNYYSRTKQLSEHKFIEFENIYSGQYWFHFSLDLNWRGEDHAGPELELGVWGHEIRLKLYDNRHWNYKESRWYVEGEEWSEMVNLEAKTYTTDEDKYYK